MIVREDYWRNGVSTKEDRYVYWIKYVKLNQDMHPGCCGMDLWIDLSSTFPKSDDKRL